MSDTLWKYDLKVWAQDKSLSLYQGSRPLVRQDKTWDMSRHVPAINTKGELTQRLTTITKTK